MTRKRKPTPKAGDSVLVTWTDIYEQPTADAAADAKLKTFRSLAYFIRWQGTGKARQLVTTNCFDIETHESYGCCSYPAGCVLSVEVI